MTILIDLKNFTLNHNVFIIDNNTIISTFKTNTKNLPELVSKTISETNCSELNISGNKKYAVNIENKIKQNLLEKYNYTKDLIIKYI